MHSVDVQQRHYVKSVGQGKYFVYKHRSQNHNTFQNNICRYFEADKNFLDRTHKKRKNVFLSFKKKLINCTSVILKFSIIKRHN